MYLPFPTTFFKHNELPAADGWAEFNSAADNVHF